LGNPPPKPTADQELQRRLQDILTRPDLPAFSEHIQQIVRYASDDSSSIQRVTEVLLREYSVSLKLLRLANSPLYNRSGRQILSVSHAASLLGLHTIRDLAASMMLLEHFRNKPGGLRELLLLSLLTANHSRKFAQMLDYPRVEEAYLCGMFRNLGEILIACYYPKDYACILVERKQHQLSERLACRKILHFHYEDLGRRMVEHWGLPPTVRNCMLMSAPPSGRINPRHRDFLASLVSHSHQLTDSVYRQNGAAAGGNGNTRGKLAQVRDSLTHSLFVSQEQLQAVLDGALEETLVTSRTLRIPVDALKLEKQIAEALLAANAPAAEPAVDSGEECPQTALEQLRQKIEGSGWELNDVLMTLLEQAYRVGSFDQVLFGLLDPQTNTVFGRLGLGETIDSLLESFHFPLSVRGGPIALAMLRRHDLFAFGEADQRYDRSAFVQALAATSFALCPVIVDGAVIGCLYCNRDNTAPFSQENAALIRQVRDLAALAIRKSRAASID
jgi:HD-like signal output (HDOD) protein